MTRPQTRPVAVVLTRDTALADHLVHELRALSWIAVPVDSCDVALEMMEVVEFSLVVVDVAAARDWPICRRLVDARRGPVAIVTGFVAGDRHYRRFAFQLGVAAYACRHCALGRLDAILRRLQGGERRIELVTCAVHGEADTALSA